MKLGLRLLNPSRLGVLCLTLQSLSRLPPPRSRSIGSPTCTGAGRACRPYRSPPGGRCGRSRRNTGGCSGGTRGDQRSSVAPPAPPA